MAKQDAAAADEGARSATRFIEQVADGQCAADLSHALHKLGLKMQTELRNRNGKCTGEVALKLKFTVEPSGVVAVAYEVNAKEPKPVTSGSVFWITKGGNFSAENPRQMAIPGVREVKRTDDVRDLGSLAANDNGVADE